MIIHKYTQARLKCKASTLSGISNDIITIRNFLNYSKVKQIICHLFSVFMNASLKPCCHPKHPFEIFLYKTINYFLF